MKSWWWENEGLYNAAFTADNMEQFHIYWMALKIWSVHVQGNYVSRFFLLSHHHWKLHYEISKKNYSCYFFKPVSIWFILFYNVDNKYL